MLLPFGSDFIVRPVMSIREIVFLITTSSSSEAQETEWLPYASCSRITQNLQVRTHQNLHYVILDLRRHTHGYSLDLSSGQNFARNGIPSTPFYSLEAVQVNSGKTDRTEHRYKYILQANTKLNSFEHAWNSQIQIIMCAHAHGLERIFAIIWCNQYHLLIRKPDSNHVNFLIMSYPPRSCFY